MFKYPVQVHKQVMLNLDKGRWAQMMSGLKDGDYEILVRPKIEWETGQMNKYYHGPVLDFIREQFKVLGNVYSKPQIKEMLKHEYGPRDMVEMGGKTVWMPRSMATYDRATYIKFINDVNAWSIDCFSCELPPADKIG